MVSIHAFFLWTERSQIRHGYPDFTVFYTAARIIRMGLGSQLYLAATQFRVQKGFTSTTWLGSLPYIHLPFEALPFVPLTRLPYFCAFLLWDSLNFVVLILVAILVRRQSRTLAGLPTWESVLAMLSLYPVCATFLQGQDAIVLLLFFALGYDALARHADGLAGLFFGLALIKYQFAIPLVMLLVLWGRWKVGLTFASTGILLAAVSIGITGWRGLLAYPHFVLQIASSPGHGRTEPAFLPNLFGLIAGWDWLGLSPPVALALLSMFSLALVGWTAHVGRRFTADGDWSGAFVLAILTAVLVSFQANGHDLTILILPFALMLDRCVPCNERTNWNWRLLGPSIPLLVSPFWMWLWFEGRRINVLAVALLGLLFAFSTLRPSSRQALNV